MADEQMTAEQTSQLFPKVATRDIDDDRAAREVLDYIGDHPGTGEWQIAQALHLPLRQVHDVTRLLEKRGELSRGESESAGA